MNRLFRSLTVLGAATVLSAAPAAAKAKKAKKTAATMEAMPARVVIYDPATAAGPATLVSAAAEEPQVPDAPLITVTTDKDAGKGMAEEKDVGIAKGKKK